MKMKHYMEWECKNGHRVCTSVNEDSDRNIAITIKCGVCDTLVKVYMDVDDLRRLRASDE